MAICNGYGITGQVLECRKSLGPIQKNCRALTALPIYSVTDGAGFCKQPTLPGLAWTRAVTWSFSDDSLIDLTVNGPERKNGPAPRLHNHFIRYGK